MSEALTAVVDEPCTVAAPNASEMPPASEIPAQERVEVPPASQEVPPASQMPVRVQRTVAEVFGNRTPTLHEMIKLRGWKWLMSESADDFVVATPYPCIACGAFEISIAGRCTCQPRCSHVPTNRRTLRGQVSRTGPTPPASEMPAVTS